MRIAAALLFVAVLSPAQIVDRNQELPKDTLATVGTQVISAKDFLERFELMPWPNKDKKDRIEFTKSEFLHSMVAEKLLAMEAAAQNVGADSASASIQRNLERLFVRDELYKREVLPNIAVPPSELREGLSRFPYEIEAAVLGILSRQEGEMLHRIVTRSKNKFRTLHTFIDSLYLPLDTLRIAYGFPDRAIEDAVFAIGRDSLSLPIESETYGWVMFALLKKQTNEQHARYSHPDRLHKVQSIIKQRKEDSIAVRTFAAVTSRQQAEADPEIFFPLADSVYAILASDSTHFLSKGYYQFPSAAIDMLESQFTGRLQEKFISMESGGMTLGEVLQGLNSNNVVFPQPLHRGHIRTVLNNNIKTVIQNEMLAREGLKKNLHQTEQVRHDLSVWMDNHKSRLLLRRVLDTLHRKADSLQGPALEQFVQKEIDVFIGSLAKKYRVVIDEPALLRTKTTTHSMVTWRHIGFGGRIIAVPQMFRQYDWKFEWQKQILINQ